MGGVAGGVTLIIIVAMAIIIVTRRYCWYAFMSITHTDQYFLQTFQNS